MNKILFLSMVSVFCSMSAIVYAEDTIPVPEPEETVVATSTPEEVIDEVVPSPEPPQLPTVSITLEIYTDTASLFSDEIDVTSCPQFPDDTQTRVTGYCAVEQSGVTAAWSWYGNDAFIDSLGGASNNYETSAYWNWFSDLSYGMTALNAHELKDGEHLLITLGRFPLQLEVPKNLMVGSTTSISVLQFGFDMNFNPIWEPALESTVVIEGVSYTSDETGSVLYTPLSTEEITLEAHKEGYLDADPIQTSPKQVPETLPEESATSGGGGTPRPKDPVENAVAFLLSHQNEDGSFATPLLSDWAAIALTSTKESTKLLKSYLLGDSDDLKTATDFERRAMALAALGVNPSEYVEEIVSFFDGTQVGDGDLVNDDIFALLVFSRNGYGDEDPMIQIIIESLVAAQESDGGWESTDLTAAAIQSLTSYSSLPDVSMALARARDFLVSHQQADGCFGNSFTTSWSIMAINALGESPGSWRSTQARSPIECLQSLQGEDGGFEEGASDDARTWATAYAIPALNGDTWHHILKKYKKLSPPDPEPSESIQSLRIEEPVATTTERIQDMILADAAPQEEVLTEVMSPSVTPLTPSLVGTAILAPGVEEVHTTLWTHIGNWLTALIQKMQVFFVAFMK